MWGGSTVVPTSTYVLIYGVPVFTVLFCIFLNIIGKRMFGVSKGDEASGEKEANDD